MNTPCVSVLMPVRNGGRYVEEAIQSILRQTFHDFEFIIIDDGSTDETGAFIERFRLIDSRVRVHSQPGQGLVAALNRGLSLARGRYIARMDADDVSLPDRLAVQVAFMESHPAVGICGTWIETFGSPQSDVRRYPSDGERISAWLLFESVLAHPSVMIRNEVLAQHGLSYDAAVPHAEDYDLWVRAARHTGLANIPEVLVRYRLHPQQVVNAHEAAKIASAQRIRIAQLHRLGLIPDKDELKLHEALSGWQFAPTRQFLTDTHLWLMKLIAANQTAGAYSGEAFAQVLAQRWVAACSAATHLGLWTWRKFLHSPLQAAAELSWPQRLKLFVKCGIRKASYV